MTNNEKALQMHKEWNGKLETTAKAHVNSREDLAIAYTPGVAEPCKVIAKDPEAAYTYTMKANTVAVVSDGSAVLGLGNIGALAAMPVMEGKCVLFKEFGGVNAVPICLDTQDTEEIIRSVVNIAPAFGGINLEDISAPRCFEIETRLKELLNIPVFHDDQHGTAIVVLAGIINALKVTGKKKEDCRVVVNGAGSAGVAITKLLLTYGFPHITMCDINGIISKDSPDLNWMQKEMTKVTNLEGRIGLLADALKGVDIPILIKNPVNPDLELWIGAFERINNAGLKQLGAIHRGFSSYDKKIYRNLPQWHIPIELRRRIPELPIFCDPSHIGGKRELVAPLCQQAMDLGFDGLIVESHCNPDCAWSDAAQQVTPDVLDYILNLLVIRKETQTTENLGELRNQIDDCDNEIIEVLAKRMRVCREIGTFKKEHDMTILQTGRYNEILDKRGAQGSLCGMDSEFIKKVFEAIHEESVRQQMEIINK